MIGVLKIIQVFLLATVKYVFTFPFAILIGLNFAQTLVAVTLGGIAGFFFFYHLSGYAINEWYQIKKWIKRHAPVMLVVKFRQLRNWRKKVTGERIFSRRNRFIVSFRARFGLLGIVALSPVVLSIPIGAFLLNKYYSKHKLAKSFMVLSILSWTAVFVAVAVVFPNWVR